MCGMLLYEVATLQISFSKRNEASFFVNLSCLLPPIESPILVDSFKIKIFVRTHWKADYKFLIHQQISILGISHAQSLKHQEFLEKRSTDSRYRDRLLLCLLNLYKILRFSITRPVLRRTHISTT